MGNILSYLYIIIGFQLWRHGDRAPGATYPLDPYWNESNWPVDFGELTNIGKQQHYGVGQWIRNRYGGSLLDDNYSENQIYVRTSDVDRTHESAQANLAGIYPAQGKQVWNDNLLWVPIPVHTVDPSTDFLIAGAVPFDCPDYYEDLDEVVLLPEITEVISKHESFLQYINNHSGFTIDTYNLENASIVLQTLQNIQLLRDTLFIETLYNKT